MSLQLTVTAGQTFTDGDPVTSTELNNGANPTVAIEDSTITSALLDLDEVVAAISPSLSTGNYLQWGSFQEERFLVTSTPVSVADGIRTPVHPGWYVLASGAAVTVAAAARSSATESAEAGRCGVKVFGHASLTSVNVGTYLPPGLAQMIYSGNVTFSCYLWNNTGATLTPALELYAGATAGDEGAVALVGTVSASASCASGQWTRVEFDFDASAVTNFAKGCHFRVKVTKATGIMDAGDYVILADAQIDPGVTTATALKRAVFALDATPAGVLLPWCGAYNAVPPGWILADGSAVSRARYAGLFANMGTTYGIGDDSTTFNLPDCRGRTLMGAEIAGSSQSRAEVAVTVASSSGDTLTVASGAAAGLRLGMGAFNGGALTGQTILELTDTTIKLSASVGSGITGTVYFSKLGAANAQTLGAAGAGLSGKRSEYARTLSGCSTASSTTLTVPGVRGIACGMQVSGTDIPAGTTVAALLSNTTLRLSAAATGTSSALSMTFKVVAPEGDAMARYEYLLSNPVMNVTTSTSGDVDIAIDKWLREYLHPGMAVTGTGVPAGAYVTTVDTDELDSFGLSAGTTNGAGTYEWTFSGGTFARETTAQAPPTPGMLPVNYIIKV